MINSKNARAAILKIPLFLQENDIEETTDGGGGGEETEKDKDEDKEKDKDKEEDKEDKGILLHVSLLYITIIN